MKLPDNLKVVLNQKKLTSLFTLLCCRTFAIVRQFYFRAQRLYKAKASLDIFSALAIRTRQEN